MSQPASSYKFVVYIPVDYTDTVKSAMFAAGAGRQGNYDQCCWQVLGKGQFRPLEGSEPFIGQASKAANCVEFVDEYRVEMLCDAPYVSAVKCAIKESHPYEEPAYDVILCV
ncbi:NGG1p interacting factor NIF3 [Eionea flava]